MKEKRKEALFTLKKGVFSQKLSKKVGHWHLYSNGRKSTLKIFSLTVTLYIGTETTVRRQKNH